MDNEATARRLAIARRIAPAYLRNPKVAVLLVAGSVGRGHADDFSDLELDVFWSAPPTEEERRIPIEVSGGEIRAIYPFEEDEWAEVFEIDGIRVDTSMFLVETMDRYLAEVVDGASTTEQMQILIAAVQDSLPLGGEATLGRWRAKAASYPDALARAMIEEHLGEPARWYYVEMLAARDDLVFLYDIVDRVVRALLGMLLGLNRMYLAHPNFKWMDQTAAAMRHAPVDLAARLRSVYRSEPPVAVQELQGLLEETLDLIDVHMPDVNTNGARKWVSAKRNESGPSAG